MCIYVFTHLTCQVFPMKRLEPRSHILASCLIYRVLLFKLALSVQSICFPRKAKKELHNVIASTLSITFILYTVMYRNLQNVTLLKSYWHLIKFTKIVKHLPKMIFSY